MVPLARIRRVLWLPAQRIELAQTVAQAAMLRFLAALLPAIRLLRAWPAIRPLRVWSAIWPLLTRRVRPLIALT